MQLPPYTKSEKQITLHLLKFRYLKINQFQKLFNHKDPHRIKEWLKDLKEKKYINVIKDPKDKTRPYVFCLAQRAGHILKNEEDVSESFLNWLYKEKDKDESFINRHLFIADAYLYFQKNKARTSELSFFTKQDLTGYKYFPDPLPDAYIDVKEKEDHSRYFLEFFDSNASPKYLRYRVRYYLKYCQDGDWQVNTNNAPLPAILFVFENEKRKKHINYYAKSVLGKSFNNDITIFLTTKSNIRFANENVDIWQRVE